MLLDEIFKLKSGGFSDEAENLGYESLFILINAGSQFVYIIFICLSQLTFSIILWIAPKNSRVFDFATGQR